MRNQFHYLSIAAAVVLAATSAARADRAPQPDVRVGAEAPPLKIMKWVKGEPLKELEEGQVYVLEFWATWCGPCVKAMPHITEIAKKFEGPVTVIGVNSSEHLEAKTEANILELVEPFVEAQGDRMGYRVAVDGPDEYMRNKWFRAAGQTGIPCTFIVGKDKKIAWIGHPMEMDKVLPQVVDGTWDMKTAAEEAANKWERQQELKEVLGPITDALRARDYTTLVVAVDAAVAKFPETEDELRPVKFEALLRTDEPAAYAYLKDAAKNEVFKKNPIIAYNFWIGMNRNAKDLQNPDWETLAGAMEVAIAAQEKALPPMLTALADVYAKLSKFEKAAAMQQKAIDAANDAESKPPAAWLEFQKKKLAEYKAKLEE